MTQVPLAAISPQLLLSAKSLAVVPLIVTEATSNVAVPVFVKVKVIAVASVVP
jgi:hypothetical protein